MNNSWVKLYRSLLENKIIDDANALQVFIYLLLTVNRSNGKVSVSRFRTSEVIHMNPSTFRNVLRRLSEKYHVIRQNKTNKYTEITLSNWDKYQVRSKVRTTRGQQEDTKRTLYTRIGELRIKNNSDFSKKRNYQGSDYGKKILSAMSWN